MRSPFANINVPALAASRGFSFCCGTEKGNFNCSRVQTRKCTTYNYETYISTHCCAAQIMSYLKNLSQDNRSPTNRLRPLKCSLLSPAVDKLMLSFPESFHRSKTHLRYVRSVISQKYPKFNPHPRIPLGVKWLIPNKFKKSISFSISGLLLKVPEKAGSTHS